MDCPSVLDFCLISSKGSGLFYNKNTGIWVPYKMKKRELEKGIISRKK
jgi:hypothetical protein